ncbi:MAG: hypothetical protein V4587_02185 [Acidobacteriota bacterium]
MLEWESGADEADGIDEATLLDQTILHIAEHEGAGGAGGDGAGNVDGAGIFRIIFAEGILEGEANGAGAVDGERGCLVLRWRELGNGGETRGLRRGEMGKREGCAKVHEQRRFMHNLGEICTEIKWLRRGSLVAYSFATEEKSFRGESGTEASRGGSATKLRFGQPKTAGGRKAYTTRKTGRRGEVRALPANPAQDGLTEL